MTHAQPAMFEGRTLMSSRCIIIRSVRPPASCNCLPENQHMTFMLLRPHLPHPDRAALIRCRCLTHLIAGLRCRQGRKTGGEEAMWSGRRLYLCVWDGHDPLQ